MSVCEIKRARRTLKKVPRKKKVLVKNVCIHKKNSVSPQKKGMMYPKIFADY